MPTLAPAPVTNSRSAEKAKLANWKNNLQALNRTHKSLPASLESVELDYQWVFARDGTLTAMDRTGQWWADCSVPLLASRALLNSLEEGPVGSCLLAPTSAGMVRAARERIGPLGVLIVVQPCPQTARMILSCDDFSAQIATHRLWFALGEDWAHQLRQLLDDQPGLATPARFIRTRLTSDELILPMITQAQEVFTAVLSDRTQQMSRIKDLPPPANSSGPLLHVGSTEFRLWDFGSSALQNQLVGRNVRSFDTDNALCGSPLALLNAAKDCSAIISANLCRADSMHLTDLDVPWITWITVPSIPAFQTARHSDVLILADPDWRTLARSAGWSDDHLRVCGWSPLCPHPLPPGEPVLGLICDTAPVHIPSAIKDFSSHRLLWDLIEEELSAEPLTLQVIDDYLTDRAQQLNIKVDTLDKRSFIEQLILPSYQQALARLLIKSSIPVSIYGKGWNLLPEFASSYAGTIDNQIDFQSAVNRCRALVYCWPTRHAHPIHNIGRPVLHRTGQNTSQLLRNARQMLTGTTNQTSPQVTLPPSLATVIADLIDRPRQDPAPFHRH